MDFGLGILTFGTSGSVVAFAYISKRATEKHRKGTGKAQAVRRAEIGAVEGWHRGTDGTGGLPLRRSVIRRADAGAGRFRQRQPAAGVISLS